ncbi:Imidazole glycerol phosphate synthase amidotransferase subunit [Candidatus Nasuia deltocephalinicola]|nr:Imidazole glycerol phosphate synthase amidotransferase subunit [Candidatus Nasuia deltocephalinicola]
MINIGLLDYSVGNLRSLMQIFKNLPLNFNIILIKNSSDFNKIDKLILPGQGSILSCLNFLKKNFLFNSLFNFIKNNPVLGICIGKHIFFNKSDEGSINSLGIFPGLVKKFNNKNLFKIPHIGWNKVKFIKYHFLLKNIYKLNYFYFSHSFYVIPYEHNYIYGLSNYNVNFSSIFIKNNIFLVQFHPEKSSYLGINLIYNFCIWNI